MPTLSTVGGGKMNSDAPSPTQGPQGRAQPHTPGPWAWFGNQWQIYLATEYGGRKFIMGFKRKGPQGAEPTFQTKGRMVPASELVRFDVGDGKAVGMVEGKADPSVYRYDFSEIDHPDARLIAAAPDLLEAAKALIESNDRTVTAMVECDSEETALLIAKERGVAFSELLEPLRAAIAKATGGAE